MDFHKSAQQKSHPDDLKITTKCNPKKKKKPQNGSNRTKLQNENTSSLISNKNRSSTFMYNRGIQSTLRLKIEDTKQKSTIDQISKLKQNHNLLK